MGESDLGNFSRLVIGLLRATQAGHQVFAACFFCILERQLAPASSA
jgi:hypothetical protein